jgi:hypothetical protein
VDYASSDTNHRTTIADTPAGTLNVSWKVLAGPATTGDMRTITIKVVQVNAPARLAAGFSSFAAGAGSSVANGAGAADNHASASSANIGFHGMAETSFRVELDGPIVT